MFHIQDTSIHKLCPFENLSQFEIKYTSEILLLFIMPHHSTRKHLMFLSPSLSQYTTPLNKPQTNKNCSTALLQLCVKPFKCSLNLGRMCTCYLMLIGPDFPTQKDVEKT